MGGSERPRETEFGTAVAGFDCIAVGAGKGETSCVSLVWAVLDRASRGRRGVGRAPATLRHLAELRHTSSTQVYCDPDSVDWSAVRDKTLATVAEATSQKSAHRAIGQLFGPPGVLGARSHFERPG